MSKSVRETHPESCSVALLLALVCLRGDKETESEESKVGFELLVGDMLFTVVRVSRLSGFVVG